MICLSKKNSNEMPKQFIWMPTYSNNVSSELYFDFLKKDQLQILNDILKKNDRYLTIKIHPLEYKIPKVKFSNIEILDNYFFIERSIELYDYINKFDALITDFSSIAIDFLVTEKPIFLVSRSYSDSVDMRGFSGMAIKKFMKKFV